MKMRQAMKRFLTCVLAIAMMITLSGVTEAQAAVKLNKKSASIYAGETVQLKLSGAKSVSWSSSNKKVASVTGKGLVKGLKKGTCVITATDTKTKKAYTCNVTVKPVQSLGISQDDIGYAGDGLGMWYNGEKISGATYYLDGKKINTNKNSIFSDTDEQGVYTCVR